MEVLLCISHSRCAIAHHHLLCRGAVGHAVSEWLPCPQPILESVSHPDFHQPVFRMRSSDFYLLCHSYAVSCKLVLGEATWRSPLVCRQPSFQWDHIVSPSKGFDYWCENIDAHIQRLANRDRHANCVSARCLREKAWSYGLVLLHKNKL